MLDRVNFHIKSGQKVIITGRSGSGKTTLLRLLQRLYDPTEGYIKVDDYNLSDIELRSLREQLGVVIQKPALFHGTIRDNVALGRPESTFKEIVEASNLAELDNFLLDKKEGFDYPVLHKGVNLSGGQQARVAMARVFLKKPSILVLDEALNALEPTMKASILQKLWMGYRDKTCLFVTDFLPAHQKADLIIVLNEGRVVEQGTFKELMQNKSYYYYLHRFQLNTARNA